MSVSRSSTNTAWRSIVVAVIISVMIASAGSARASDASNTAPASPTASVKIIVDQATAVFKDQGVAPADREKKLRTIAESHFNFESMARTAVGHHWREFTPDQQSQFVPMFTGFIEDVYLSQMEHYSVEKVQQVVESSNVQFVRERIDTPDQAVVFSEVTLQNRGKPLDVNYMLKRANTEWKIYDITIDAISVIANYRNQFNRVLNDGGYDKLAAIMRQKQQALGAAMAN
jgi:phospholipid transport system substrate-binding protein